MRVVEEKGEHLQGMQQQANTRAGRPGINQAAVPQRPCAVFVLQYHA
jgi:hypothetical protein